MNCSRRLRARFLAVARAARTRGKAAEGCRTPKRFASTGIFQNLRQLLDCASPLALFPPSPIHTHLKFIRHRNPIRLESVNGLHHRRRSHAFKPSRRTPRILAGDRHESVFHRVLMDVVQPRQIRALMREPGFAEVEPNLPARRGIQLIHPLRRFDVQDAQHIA